MIKVAKTRTIGRLQELLHRFDVLIESESLTPVALCRQAAELSVLTGTEVLLIVVGR